MESHEHIKKKRILLEPNERKTKQKYVESNVLYFTQGKDCSYSVQVCALCDKNCQTRKVEK